MSRNRTAERSLISSVIRTGDMGAVLDAGITEQWFRVYPTQWKFIEARYRLRRRPPSLATFKDKFPDFVLSKSDDTDYAVANMRRYHAQQTMLGIINGATESLEDEREIEEAIAQMHRSLVSLQGDLTGRERETDMVSDWTHTYAEMKRRADLIAAGESIGIPTGFPSIDEILGGWQPGRVHIAGARLNVGKTFFGIRAAVEAVKAGKTVQFQTLEQTRTEMGIRIAPFMAKAFGKKAIKQSDISKGKGDLRAVRSFFVETAKGTTGKLIVDDTPRGRLSMAALAAKAKRNETDLLIIDYVQLLSSTPGDWTALAQISAELKDLSISLDNLSILALSQTNRSAGTTDEADSSSLSQSDNLGMDADFVAIMHEYSTRARKIRCVKNRHGEKGAPFYAEFDVNVGVLEEIGKQRADDLRDEDRDHA